MVLDASNKKYAANEIVIGIVENKKNALFKSIETFPLDSEGQIPILV